MRASKTPKDMVTALEFPLATLEMERGEIRNIYPDIRREQPQQATTTVSFFPNPRDQYDLSLTSRRTHTNGI